MTAPVTLNAEAARNALRQVKDPELDMNIIDLGLVYDVEIVEGEVRVKMTLTSPGCPERAGWPGASASRACGPSRGVCTPGWRGDGTAWCGAQASARFRNRMAERSR